MRIADLCCGAGGAAMGLHRAFPDAEIVGVDIRPQKNYPFTFVQGDALEFDLSGFDFVWASPPCQRYAAVTRWRGKASDHPDLLPLVLRKLAAVSVPWVVENVLGAPMPATVLLCGSMFGLKVRRHRRFVTSWSALSLQPGCDHRGLLPFMHKGERAYADALDCGWMTSVEAREAIPPAFSHYLATEWQRQQPIRTTAASRLTVLEIVRVRGKKPLAICVCSCGKSKTTQLGHIRSGAVRSCGCLQKESSAITGHANTTHGHARPSVRSATYRSWECMKSRCTNPADPGYADYGGRGISVCDSWKSSFEAFLHDMGPRLRGTTIDRIDVQGNYEPVNCRWAVPSVQHRNKRNNRTVIFNGESMLLIVLSEKTGVPYQRLHERIVRRGWTAEDAVKTPPKGYW